MCTHRKSKVSESQQHHGMYTRLQKDCAEKCLVNKGEFEKKISHNKKKNPKEFS